MSRYDAAVPQGKQQFAELNLARERAKNIKWRALGTLDQQLEDFVSSFTKRGGRVIWAENTGQALAEILDICKDKSCRTIVKSKSMVTEELKLNHFLEDNGIESVETDLGEYIQQLDGEPPYHIVTPAMHKSKEDVAKLFYEKLNTKPGLSPEQLTLVAREKLRKKYVQAEIGVTGANFLISDIGGIAVTENEGNGRLSASFPKTHIVIVGLEKLIPSMTDLGLFWPLLATYGTGQRVTVYNTIITGPRQPGETDGPEEMYVILLDNGRTNILANAKARESLYCIRCGACLNACPIYKNIGGHSYNTPYSGPIGSIITPHMRGMENFKHLSYASSLCGKCTEVCPVKIDIHKMLLLNRRDSVKHHLNTKKERWGWSLWKKGMLSRKMADFFGGKTKNFFLKTFFKKTWGHFREMP